MSNFANRLSQLIGGQSVSGFARKVGVSEALIRKYLKGSEPSLAKANQIAIAANCSLEWLATGCGYQYRQSEVVDMEALSTAIGIVNSVSDAVVAIDIEVENLKPVIVAYQHLRAHKKLDGFLDKTLTTNFLKSIEKAC